MTRPLSVNSAKRNSHTLAESTTVGTVGTSTVAAVQVTSWHCLPILARYECVTSATHSCCSIALPPWSPDRANTAHMAHTAHTAHTTFTYQRELIRAEHILHIKTLLNNIR